MVRDVQGPDWPFIRFQNFGLGGEIPRVIFGQLETGRGLFLWLCVLICYCYD